MEKVNRKQRYLDDLKKIEDLTEIIHEYAVKLLEVAISETHCLARHNITYIMDLRDKMQELCLGAKETAALVKGGKI